jgi:hypothetical protein
MNTIISNQVAETIALIVTDVLVSFHEAIIMFYSSYSFYIEPLINRASFLLYATVAL